MPKAQKKIKIGHTFLHMERWKKENEPKSIYFITQPPEKQLVKSPHSKHA